MTITVSCAAGGTASAAEFIEAGATLEERTAAFQAAIERATETGSAVLVRF
jgi:hypothetical protein